MQDKKCILHDTIVTYLSSDNLDKDNTLLFLHGWMQDKNSFNDIFQLLDEKSISYISLDLPGFGGTALLSDSMEIENYGSFVIDFIEKIGLVSPTLVGHSFGGRIAIYLGSFYENISQIVLIGAAGIAPKMNPTKLSIVKAGKVFFALPGLKGLGKRVKSKVSASDYKSAGNMTQIYRNTIKNDLQKYMKQIPLSTLMIWGESDDQVTLQEAEVMKKHIQSSQLEILEGTHFIHQEEPQKVTDFILDFIQK